MAGSDVFAPDEDGCAARAGRLPFAVVSGADRLDLHNAADALGVNRHELRLATEADMSVDFPGDQVGAIPPLGPDTPAELIDPRLLEYEHVLCPAGDHEHSLVIDPVELVRATGRALWSCVSTGRPTAMATRAAAGLNKAKTLARLQDLERRGLVRRVGNRWAVEPRVMRSLDW